MNTTDIQPVLRALLRDKVHVQRGLTARLPSRQADYLHSPLDLARLALMPLQTAPVALLTFWLTLPRGHVLINATEQDYQPGTVHFGRNQYQAAAMLKADALLRGEGLALPLATLFDHLLGSTGTAQGEWLSAGAGCTPAWQAVGQALQRQHALGYAPPEVAGKTAAYFAWGLRLALANPQTLSATDPGLARLLRTTVLDAHFCRQQLPFIHDDL
ncbi:MAG: hypothetical protein ABTQ73_09445 [Caldilineales bacterium]